MKTFGMILLTLSAVGMIQLMMAWQTGRLTTITPKRQYLILTVNRAEKPEDFKGLVAYQMIMTTVLFTFGMICLPTRRWSDPQECE